MELLTAVTPYLAAVSGLLSLAVLGFILRLTSAVRSADKARSDALKAQNETLQSRLDQAQESLEQLRRVDRKVTEVGAFLGLPQAEDDAKSGVNIRDIGDNFSGKIAGRDMVDVLNKLGDQVSQVSNVVDDRREQVTELATGSISVCQQTVEMLRQVSPTLVGARSYSAAMIFERRPEEIATKLTELSTQYAPEGYRLAAFVPAYQDLDGCLVLFERAQ